ncbi:uncharacterized protein CELE_K02D10.8 [Caenorhabditis elegans]|uniref:Uncharacterized protein n=1 Tax=Caenorhabditis elegans TaxID=6239 RepID=H8W3Z6_CAEEL|nr:Uncharacterized protein CELE_K02D10.8 [Caenorhabditis elegans]CCG28200.1 Uncharacterized protein CELE_K02D10.8 [Caenorhabditis elegans]|eukprot:NP_001254965.1 Uncharacterized protein CELE_K02D10.8 [Caenorhabditis elegans]
MMSFSPFFFIFLSIFSLFLMVDHSNSHLIPPKISDSSNSNPTHLTENLIACGSSFCDPEFCEKSANKEKIIFECQMKEQ